MSYRIDKERFCYNKDSAERFFIQGNKTEIKKYDKDKREKEYPSKINCISSKFKEDSKHPILSKIVSINSSTSWSHSLSNSSSHLFSIITSTIYFNFRGDIYTRSYIWVDYFLEISNLGKDSFM
jgi:hypothetical protein